MANISGGKSRCEGWLPLQAAFGSRWKPFGRPVRDLAKGPIAASKRLERPPVFLRLSSSHWALLTQTSDAEFMNLRPKPPPPSASDH